MPVQNLVELRWLCSYLLGERAVDQKRSFVVRNLASYCAWDQYTVNDGRVEEADQADSRAPGSGNRGMEALQRVMVAMHSLAVHVDWGADICTCAIDLDVQHHGAAAEYTGPPALVILSLVDLVLRGWLTRGTCL